MRPPPSPNRRPRHNPWLFGFFTFVLSVVFYLLGFREWELWFFSLLAIYIGWLLRRD
jgi:hypothetical protein